MGAILNNHIVDNQPFQKLDIRDLYRAVRTDDDIETAIKAMLAIMTLEEKLGQLSQFSYDKSTLDQDTRNQIVQGRVGSVLWVTSVNVVNEMQKVAMEQSRMKIPIIPAKDVIHGFRTVLPIPLAQAASFNPDGVEAGARNAAIEATTLGIRWTFSPMMDIARDARWGRMAEGYGEDPYLAGRMAVSAVKGYQSLNLKDPTAMAACAKHFAGYGAGEGGRDDNTALIPENTLRDIYLYPFREASKVGCLTYMSAYHQLNGVPCTGSEFLLKQVLRKEWNFNGFVVSDWNAVTCMINHGFAENEADAARKGLNSGVDMEMQSSSYMANIPFLIDKGLVKQSDVDYSTGNVLRVKFKLDLFNNYYTDPARAAILLDKKHLATAKSIASQSAVLLQNTNKTLPLSKTLKSIAVIGPLADDGDNQLGCWAPDGLGTDTVTPLKSLKDAYPGIKLNVALGFEDCNARSRDLYPEALTAVRSSDVVVMFMGESSDMSGEGSSRSNISLPGLQEDLIQVLSAEKKPIVLVINAGRALTLSKIIGSVQSILYTWQLGTMAGPAIVDLLFGTSVPSGKLPVTFPRERGQIPTYYNKKNTGRPNNTHEYIPYTSSYLDIDTTPLYTFGYGLSYTTFTYSAFKLSKKSITYGETIVASAILKNEGTYIADEVTMLFVRDLAGSYTRPVRELKNFKRTTLKPGEFVTLTFILSTDELSFWTKKQEWKAEPGVFQVWIGGNADATQTGQFELTATAAKQEQEFEELGVQ